uniref:Uncharacterized protein n=1 Tax=Sphaerodactylus townsendi TaxID=933632 RepID=A0ACB8G3A6_9SAUR
MAETPLKPEENPAEAFTDSSLFAHWGQDLSPENRRVALKQFQYYGYNAYLSDRLPLDRALPDFRPNGNHASTKREKKKQLLVCAAAAKSLRWAMGGVGVAPRLCLRALVAAGLKVTGLQPAPISWPPAVGLLWTARPWLETSQQAQGWCAHVTPAEAQPCLSSFLEVAGPRCDVHALHLSPAWDEACVRWPPFSCGRALEAGQWAQASAVPLHQLRPSCFRKGGDAWLGFGQHDVRMSCQGKAWDEGGLHPLAVF